MSFFQNVFNEYQGFWSLGDHKDYALTFKVPGNKNSGEVSLAWENGPYDLSASGVLTINVAIDRDFKIFSTINVDVTGADAGATKASEIRDILNSDSNFSSWFTASTSDLRFGIRQKKSNTSMRHYVVNSGAENVVKFNKFAGVADIPSFFEKDTIAKRMDSPEANNCLVRLSHSISTISVANPTVVTTKVPHLLTTGDKVFITGSNSTPSINGEYTATVTGASTFTIPVNVTTAGTTAEFLNETEKNIVETYGLDYSTMLADWQHLKGRSGLFQSTVNTLDGSGRIVSQIIWQTGASVGSLAKKLIFTYSGANTTPSTTMEVPYVLTSSDVLRP